MNPVVTVFSSNSTIADFGDTNGAELYGDFSASATSGLALTIINNGSWNTVEALLTKANGTLTAFVTPCELSFGFPLFVFFCFSKTNKQKKLRAPGSFTRTQLPFRRTRESLSPFM